MSREARIVGHDAETGKVRVRVPADYTLTAYRNLGEASGDVSFTPRLSAKQEATRYRDKAVRSSMDSERQNELLRGGLDRKANVVIGPALSPNPLPDIRWLGQDIKWMVDYQQAAHSVFQEWGTDERCLCDAKRHYQFSGLMWMAFRGMASGEAETAGYIGYDRDRANAYGHKWATYVRVIEPSWICNPQGYQNGPHLHDGRELDDWGAFLGLHVMTEDPADAGVQKSEFLPRETEIGRPFAWHWFFKRRPDMQRALTSLTAVLRTLELLNSHSDATLQNAVANAYLATFVKTTMSPEQAREHMAPAPEFNNLSEYELKTAAYKDMNINFGGKRIPVLGPNDSIEFAALERSNPDFSNFRNAFLRELASALNVSYEQLSLDFSRANFASTRSSILEAWRQITFERVMFTNHVASLVYSAVIEEAFALNILKVPRGAPDFYAARGAYTRVQWIGPGMGWVDPLKDINAAQARVALGVSTLSEESATQGGNWYMRLQQKAIEEQLAAQLGTTIDTGGGVVAADDGPDDPPPGDDA